MTFMKVTILLDIVATVINVRNSMFVCLVVLM